MPPPSLRLRLFTAATAVVAAFAYLDAVVSLAHPQPGAFAAQAATADAPIASAATGSSAPFARAATVAVASLHP